ncbi:MAG: HNH endonuclease [Acidobacteriota bacterium]|jgi:5-methylcytosine-specific restriction endonuclease McrA
MSQTLLLNATYEPLQVVTWQRAVRMIYQDKVEVLEHYSREIHSVTIVMKVPSVVRLRHYVRVRRSHTQVKFSRQNLFARDKFRCQYCGQRLAVSDLTYDHVIPVARGGRKSWENIVTSCIPCNRKKANHTPEEVGMRLLKNPSAPASFPARAQLLFSRMQTPTCWRMYIFS